MKTHFLTGSFHSGGRAKILLLAAALAAGFPAAAGTSTWLASPSANNWNNAADWNTLPNPANPDGVAFGTSTVTALTNDFAAGSAFAAITYNSGASAFFLNGNGINLAGGITNNGTVTQTNNLPLALMASVTVNTASGSILLGNGLTGANTLTLTKAGGSTLTLAGGSTNTFSGAINVNAGILTTLNAASMKYVTNVVTVAAGAAFVMNQNYDATAAVSCPVVLSGTGTGGYGALDGEYNLTMSGPVTLNTASEISHSWGNFSENGTIMAAGGGQNLLLLTLQSGQPNLTMGGSLSLGTGALTVTGSGSQGVVLSVSNNYTGGTIFNSGLLQLGNAGALGTGGLTVNGGTLNLNTYGITVASLAGTGGIITDNGAGTATTALTVNQTGATSFAGLINNGTTRSLGLTLGGTGALVLLGNSTYSGATAVNAGELAGGTGGSLVNSAVTVAAGATNGVQAVSYGAQWVCPGLTYNTGTAYLDINLTTLPVSATVAPLQVNGNLTVNGTVNVLVRNGYFPSAGTYPLVSYTGTLTGGSSFALAGLPAGVTATLVNNTGAKRLDLSVTAVPTVTPTVSAWTNLVSGNAGGSWGTNSNWSPNAAPNSSDAVANFGTVSITANSFITNDAPHTAGTLVFATGSGYTWTVDGTNNPLTLATSLGLPTFDVTNTEVFLGGFKGTNGLIKNGNGVLALYGQYESNSLSGPIVVNSGVLGTVNSGTFKNITSPITVAAGATFQANASYGSTVLSNTIYLSGSGATPGGYVGNAATPDGTYNGESTPFGALDLQGNVTYAGTINLNAASVISHGYNVATVSGPIVASGAGQNLQFAITVSGQYPVTVGAGMNLGSGSLTVNSVAGGGSASTPAATVVLNAANTYSGGTLVTNYAILQVGNAGALGSGGLTVYSNAIVNLNTYNVSVPSLTGAAGSAITDKGAAGTTTLTVNQAAATTFAGIITNGPTRTVALTLSGAGALALAGTNTYSGPTAVNAGELIGVTGGSCSNSPVTVAAGATNGVLVTAAGGQWVCGNLTNAAGTTFEDFNFGTNLPSATAPLVANGNFTLNGVLNIIIRSSGLVTNGVFPLVHYTGTLAGTPPTNAFILPAGWGGSISNDTANKSLDLVVTNGTLMQWAVGNATWDINTTANWKDPNGTAEKYSDGDAVTFNDTASGASPITVTLNATASPLSVTVNNTNKNYTLSGTGGIAGTAALVKQGSAGSTLTMALTNTYSGGTTVSGGTLTLGLDNALGTGPLTVASGTGNPTVWLNLNGHTLTNAIANTGGDCYLYNSSSTLATLAGPVNIGSYSRVGYYAQTTPGAGNILVSGVYSGGWYSKQGAGVLILPGTNNYTGQTLVNGGAVRAADGAGITTNNLNLADIYGVGAVFESTGGNFIRSLGTGANQVQLTNGSCGFSAYGAPVTVAVGGLSAPATLVWGTSTLNVSSLILNYYTANTNLTLANALDLNGTNRTISVQANVATVAGVITNSTGTAGLTLTGGGTLVLTNANTYNGVTAVGAGTLALSGAGSIANSTLISITNGAVFNVSGLSSAFTLGSGQTLSNNAAGTGTVNGSLGTGTGTLAVTYTNGTPSFMITNGTLTLTANTVFTVNNIGTALATGTYKVISKATGGSVTGGTLPAVTVTGGGLAAGRSASLALVNGELNLLVQMLTTNTLTLSAGSNPSTYGNSVTFQATVNPAPTNGETVTFRDGVTTLGTGAITGGVATFSTNGLPVAVHSITAVYGGDAVYDPSTSGVLSLTVNKAALGVTANNTNKVYVAGGPAFSGGNGVAYYGFVNGDTAAVLGGAISYGGTSQGATNAGTYTIVPAGLTAANYSITYTNGTLTISPAGPTLTVGSSQSPIGYLGSVSFSAMLPADATGSVVFSSTNGAFSTNTLSAGTASSLAITNLARGTNAITVVYGGDGNYLAATNLFNEVVTNHAPVAGLMTVTITAGMGGEIALTDLATNWTDVDGDTVELMGINLATTNGTSLFPIDLMTNLDGSLVITNLSYLGYTNPSNVADQISYSIGDGFGGTNVGYINIVIQSSVTGTNSITGITGGNPNGLTAYGVPGFSYVTERSTNLTDWVEISTNTAATNGVISVTDPFSDLGGNAPPAAYYRLLWHP